MSSSSSSTNGASGDRPPNGSPGAPSPEPKPAQVLEPSPLPPLVLAPSDPPRLIYERASEPSEESPILYRERAFVVDSLLSDEELESHLMAELDSLRSSLADRRAPQFVQLAAFDHSFDEEPSAPPLATLSWKGWHGRTEVWVRGAQRSTLVNDAQAGVVRARAEDLGGAPASPQVALPHEPSDLPPPSSWASSQPDESLPSEDDWGRADDVLSVPPPVSSVTHTAPDARSPPDSEAGMSWSAPNRSGQFPAVRLEEAPVPPPSSERVLANEELIGALFERMHELLYLPDIESGASFVVETLAELIAPDAALVYVFDLDAREFVVVRALGPGATAVSSRRVASSRSYLEGVLRRQIPERFGPEIMDQPGAVWRDLGLSVGHVLCVPVHQHGRYLGAIELAREPGKRDFTGAHQNALEYVCAQFADFVAARPIAPDRDPSA